MYIIYYLYIIWMFIHVLLLCIDVLLRSVTETDILILQYLIISDGDGFFLMFKIKLKNKLFVCYFLPFFLPFCSPQTISSHHF